MAIDNDLRKWNKIAKKIITKRLGAVVMTQMEIKCSYTFRKKRRKNVLYVFYESVESRKCFR